MYPDNQCQRTEQHGRFFVGPGCVLLRETILIRTVVPFILSICASFYYDTLSCIVATPGRGFVMGSFGIPGNSPFSHPAGMTTPEVP